MFEPQAQAVIDQLKRANKQWKRLAFAALSVLTLVIAVGAVIGVYQRVQLRTERERAEQAMQEAQMQKDQAQRELYLRHIAMAEKAWDARQQQEEEP